MKPLNVITITVDLQLLQDVIAQLRIGYGIYMASERSVNLSDRLQAVLEDQWEKNIRQGRKDNLTVAERIRRLFRRDPE